MISCYCVQNCCGPDTIEAQLLLVAEPARTLEVSLTTLVHVTSFDLATVSSLLDLWDGAIAMQGPARKRDSSSCSLNAQPI